MCTDLLAILIMSASLTGKKLVFPLKEAHFSAYLLQGAISLRMLWALRLSWADPQNFQISRSGIEGMHSDLEKSLGMLLVQPYCV